MKTITTLATLVAMFLVNCLVFSGCIPLAGPQNCEFGVVGFGCAPNPDATGDAGSNYDGSSSETTPNTDTVSNDTVEVDAVQVVCKDYLYLITGETWDCTFSGNPEKIICTLGVEISSEGLCEIWCSGVWVAPPSNVSLLASGQLQYQMIGATVHTCTKVK